tara:strand:+ start:508 stop:1110 length:603 start_codon:yes stop_codon:yes gene_type:complete
MVLGQLFRAINKETTMNDADWVILGYQRMITERIRMGWDPHFITFMFRQLPGGQAARGIQMERTIDKVYGRVVSRMFRAPNAGRVQHLRPFLVISPDFPVYKKDKDSFADVSINDGQHMQGIWLMPPWPTRLEGNLSGHFLNHKEKYLQSYSELAKIDCRQIEETPEKMVDYMFKNLKRGRTIVDEICIWPRSISERPQA